MVGKIPHKKCGFGISYGIGRKYWPMLVSVSVSDLNKNSGFGRTLVCGLNAISIGRDYFH